MLLLCFIWERKFLFCNFVSKERKETKKISKELHENFEGIARNFGIAHYPEDTRSFVYECSDFFRARNAEIRNSALL